MSAKGKKKVKSKAVRLDPGKQPSKRVYALGAVPSPRKKPVRKVWGRIKWQEVNALADCAKEQMTLFPGIE